MNPAKLIAVAIGAVAAMLAFVLLAAGGVLLWAQATQRDAEGFYTSPAYELGTGGYALTTEEVELATHPGDWVPAPGDLRLRVTAEPAGDQPVFIGVAPQADVDAYLADVPHARITDLDENAHRVVYRTEQGTGTPAIPGEQAFWAASTEGTGGQTLTWDPQQGTWALVVMNADATPGVGLAATAAVDIALLRPVAIALLVAGLVAAAVAVALLIAGTRARSAPGRAPLPQPATPGLYPVRLTGQLDPGLSRWMWLVKWFLALPHVFVLAFLWAAFAVLTVVAGFAILFTGRYPRGIFEFNVGVLRWTWRVTFYAYGVLGSDRYPPFTLAADPDDPVAFDVAYPQQLSRGLVLVKWWLLAIPHYLIIGFFTGNAAAWTVDTGQAGNWQTAVGGGLIGVLVLVAVIVLAFAGRYPQGLFDLIMGLQRWVHRVTAYAALMTDEYPPFRLDNGGSEPEALPAVPVTGGMGDTGDMGDMGPRPAHA